jgi:membrane associated rhomboid family serine protease
MSYPGRFRLPLPPATRTLFLANLAVFFANALLLGRLSDPPKGAWFAFSWPALWEGYGLGLLRVVTYQFTHSFADVMHLLTNMLALWVFGPMAESRLGPRGTLRLYLVGGTVGALGHLGMAALQGSAGVSLVGASGACYALMLYAACVAPHATIVFMIVQMPLWALAALLVGIGVYSTFVELAAGYGGGVSHSAHLGGAALGFAAYRLGWFVDWQGIAGEDRPWPWQRWLQVWRARRAARSQQSADAEELQLDAILAKVKAQGLTSLSPAERRFLEQQSARKANRGS